MTKWIVIGVLVVGFWYFDPLHIFRAGETSPAATGTG